MGADRLGLPLYGIIAGLGVGGLAIALAAQPTIENLIGGLGLFADKPIRVSNLCRCGRLEKVGSPRDPVHADSRCGSNIGATIPNAALSRMPVVNLSQRDRLLIKCVFGVRYETSPEQLRYLLARTREILLSHPRIDSEGTRARFVGFGASRLGPRSAHLCHQFGLARASRHWEDVFLRIMDMVKESGTGFAFPSQTLYFARDDGLDAAQAQAAEARVRQWRERGCLPFSDFPPEQERQMRGSLVYPPPGSAASARARMSSQAHSSTRDAQTATAEAEPAMHDPSGQSSRSTSTADAGKHIRERMSAPSHADTPEAAGMDVAPRAAFVTTHWSVSSRQAGTDDPVA